MLLYLRYESIFGYSKEMLIEVLNPSMMKFAGNSNQYGTYIYVGF